MSSKQLTFVNTKQKKTVLVFLKFVERINATHGKSGVIKDNIWKMNNGGIKVFHREAILYLFFLIMKTFW